MNSELYWEVYLGVPRRAQDGFDSWPMGRRVDPFRARYHSVGDLMAIGQRHQIPDSS
ncbi:hypothetical protein [Pontibacter sp. G13]|uniref:hypothetical protein n=1 Tax=Pontibacter sp. G13 TaxID=3074898 RepID=UPI00288B3C8F|nr:hypothetical protein [Pontibacter sp. G13]WNJ20323.1 hypothetical protein RJD25_07570 [Pontibacter sp. G13]